MAIVGKRPNRIMVLSDELALEEIVIGSSRFDTLISTMRDIASKPGPLSMVDRNFDIHQDYTSGMSLAKVAEKHGITRMRVRQILSWVGSLNLDEVSTA